MCGIYIVDSKFTWSWDDKAIDDWPRRAHYGRRPVGAGRSREESPRHELITIERREGMHVCCRIVRDRPPWRTSRIGHTLHVK
jgi:hypothetical protein